MALTKVSGDILDTGIVVAGVTTSTNFKTGTSNLHNVGIEIAGINVLGADTPIGAGVTIYNSGGADFTGVVTATRFVGQADISGGSITATTGTFSGDVSIGGTLTYQDVTNIDSVGLGTFRNGINVTAGVSTFAAAIDANGGANIAGGLVVNSAKISDLTSGRVTYAGASGELVDSANLTFNGSDLLIDAATNAYKGVKFDNSFNLTFGSSSGASPRLYLKGTSNSQSDAGDTFLATGSGGEQWFQSNTFTSFKVNADSSAAEVLRLTADGKVSIGDLASPDGNLHVYNSTAGSVTAATDANDLVLESAANVGMSFLTGATSLSRIKFGDTTATNRGIFYFNHSTTSFNFQLTSSLKLTIDSSGNIIPGAAGTQNLGSTSKEWGDLYFANSKGLKLGSSQVGDLYNDGTDTYFRNSVSNGQILIRSGGNIWISDYAGNHRAAFRDNSAVDLYYDIENNATAKLSTTVKGISVHGEVAASQDYPTIRPTLDLNFASVKKLDSRITYRRTGPASYVDEFGKIVLVGDNTPRFDHDPSTRECKGFLIEESRKNYLENGDFVSSYGSGNSWTYGVGTDVFSASSGSQLSTNPDGSSPAYHYAPSSTAGYHRFYRTVTVDAYDTSYVASVFVKRVTAGSASNLNRYFEIELSGDLATNGAPTGHSGSHGMSSVTFDLQDITSQYAGNSAVKVSGLVGDPRIEDYGNGWYRCSYVFNPGTNDGSSTLTAHMWLGHPATMAAEAGNEQGNGNPSFYIWGAMVEKGASLTSYVPNHGAYQTTRGKDLAEIDGEEFTDFFNQDEGTINCAYWLGNDNIGLRVFQINDSNNSVIDIVAGSGSGSGGYGYVNTGGTAQANGGQSSANASRLNTLHVTTLAYKANDVAGINIKTGVLTNDTSATLDGAYNRVTFYQGANGADQLNGHLQRVQYYPKRLPDNQLKNLNNQ